MPEMSEAQKSAIKNLVLLGAFYLGTRVTEAWLRYTLFAFLAYNIYAMNKNPANGPVSGWGMKVDTDLAVDMLFPKMDDEKKAYAKLAARNLMQGMMPS